MRDTNIKTLWRDKQRKKENALLCKDESKMTQLEHDVYNLEWIQTTIGYGSILYRMGCFKSLNRAIKLLKRELQIEKRNKEDNNVRIK